MNTRRKLLYILFSLVLKREKTSFSVNKITLRSKRKIIWNESLSGLTFSGKDGTFGVKTIIKFLDGATLQSGSFEILGNILTYKSAFKIAGKRYRKNEYALVIFDNKAPYGSMKIYTEREPLKKNPSKKAKTKKSAVKPKIRSGQKKKVVRRKVAKMKK